MGDKRKMKHTPEEIKYRLSNIGEAIGNIALNYITELEKENAELKKQIEELKEFYEIEYFQIADRTADEKIKELEKYQVEVTIDDYSPYDENTWGMMHEEMFVPKNLVLDMLKEIYAYIENLKKENAELKEKLKTAYRKGMRHMAKALKDYDRTDGAWTDYFEHTVDKVLQREQVDFEEYGTLADQLTEAKKIILMLYNAGRDVLMYRNEEKAYDNLSKAVNDKSIEQFMSEVKKRKRLFSVLL